MKLAKAAVINVALFAFGLAFSLNAKAVMNRDESRIAEYLADGNFTTEEKKSTTEIMKTGGYYGVKAKLSYYAGSYLANHTFYCGSADMQWFINRSAPAEGWAKAHVWLWRTPTTEVKQAANSRAKAAIQRIYSEIAAIKALYPELELFNKDQVELTDDSLTFSPTKPSPDRISTPQIVVSLKEPQLSQSCYSEIYPAQAIALSRSITVQDDELEKRVYDIITRSVVPLVDAESALGSYSVGQYCGVQN